MFGRSVVCVLVVCCCFLSLSVSGQSAAQCSTATTYNDGYVNFDSTNYLTIATPDSGLVLGGGVSFTITAWLRRSNVGSDSFFFGAGAQNDAGATRAYLHCGLRNTNKATLAFYDDDYTPTSTFTDTDWHHWAFRYDSSQRRRRIFRDGSQVSNTGSSGSDASADFSVVSGLKIRIGGIMTGTTWKFQGDMDELMIFNSALGSGVIANLAAGNLWGYTTRAQGCLLWLRFNEGSGANAADSATGFASNTAVWTSTQAWRAGGTTTSGQCLSGYWDGWRVTPNTPNVRVGTTVTITVQQIDNFDTAMSTYSTKPSATTVKVMMAVSAGAVLSLTSTTVSMTSGVGSFTLSSDRADTVTFTIADSANTGRTRLITTQQVFSGPALTSMVIISDTLLTYTPQFAGFTYSYTVTDSLPYISIASRLVVNFGATATSVTLVLNGVDVEPLASGVVSSEYYFVQGTNTVSIRTVEFGQTFTYSWTVVRFGPDVTGITFTSLPSISQAMAPAFTPLNFMPRSIGIGGIIQQLSVAVAFGYTGSDSPARLFVNGVVIATATGAQSGVPIDITASILPMGSNTIQVESARDGGTYSFTVQLACPVALTCTRAKAPTAACAYNCNFCAGTVFRQVCLQERPDCCGQAGCDC